MKRFLRKNLSAILLWFFIGTLFADGANLDDLFAGDVVVHDDQDVIACASTTGEAMSPLPAPVKSVPHQIPSKQRTKDMPAAPVRVIVDQDSPSLAPDPLVQTLFTSVSGSEEKLSLPNRSHTQGELHLRFCTLLI